MWDRSCSMIPPAQFSDRPASLTHFHLVGGTGHAAALVDDLRTGRSDGELSHLARDTYRVRRGAICPGDRAGTIRPGQGENGRAGAAETGAQGAGSACGGDQDLEMGKESRP